MAGDGNSWEKPAGNFADHVQLGKLTIIPGDDWDSSAYVYDVSVSDTWEEADFSGYVPPGVNGLYVYIYILTSSANDQSLLLVRGDGETGGTGRAQRALRISAEQGANDIVVGTAISIYAPGGIFDYRRYSSAYPIDSLNFVLRGYYT